MASGNHHNVHSCRCRRHSAGVSRGHWATWSNQVRASRSSWRRRTDLYCACRQAVASTASSGCVPATIAPAATVTVTATVTVQTCPGPTEGTHPPPGTRPVNALHWHSRQAVVNFSVTGVGSCHMHTFSRPERHCRLRADLPSSLTVPALVGCVGARTIRETVERTAPRCNSSRFRPVIRESGGNQHPGDAAQCWGTEVRPVLAQDPSVQRACSSSGARCAHACVCAWVLSMHSLCTVCVCAHAPSAPGWLPVASGNCGA